MRLGGALTGRGAYPKQLLITKVHIFNSEFFWSVFISLLSMINKNIFLLFQKLVMSHYLTYLTNEVDNIKYPVGTRQNPATTCREIYDNLDNANDGKMILFEKTFFSFIACPSLICFFREALMGKRMAFKIWFGKIPYL